MRKYIVSTVVRITLALIVLGYGIYNDVDSPIGLYAILWILIEIIALIVYTRKNKPKGKDKDLLDD